MYTKASSNLLGLTFPENTVRNNHCSFRAFSRYIYSEILHFPLTTDDSTIFGGARHVVFSDDQQSHKYRGYKNFCEDELRSILHFLIAFFAIYRAVDGSYISLVTPKNYLLGLQRAFRMGWGYNLQLLERPIFACPNYRFLSVIENRARYFQREVIRPIPHEVFSKDDIFKLYSSTSLSKETPSGFQARLIFTIGIFTAVSLFSCKVVHVVVSEVSCPSKGSLVHIWCHRKLCWGIEKSRGGWKKSEKILFECAFVISLWYRQYKLFPGYQWLYEHQKWHLNGIWQVLLGCESQINEQWSLL